VWRARFRGKFEAAEDLVLKFGSDAELFKLYKLWHSMAVECMQKSKNHNCRITWGTENEATTLIFRRKRQTALEEPEDELWPLDLYVVRIVSSPVSLQSEPPGPRPTLWRQVLATSFTWDAWGWGDQRLPTGPRAARFAGQLSSLLARQFVSVCSS
jgi:hypothetical protein